MSASTPLDRNALHELALHYAGRYATTRAKLGRYLQRKLRERGWAEEAEPEVPALVERMAELGLVDDEGYAGAQARAMARRGLGARRIGGALAAAGVATETRSAALEEVDADAAALAYAKKRRLGRFRDGGPGDFLQARKDMAAMLRAGHGFTQAKAALGGGALDLDAED